MSFIMKYPCMEIFIRGKTICTQMLLPNTPLPQEDKDNIMQIHSILLQSETAGLARGISVHMPMKVMSGKPVANEGCRVKLKMQVKSTGKMTSQTRILQIQKN